MSLATPEQYTHAGEYAAKWFRCLENTLRRVRTDEQHVLEDTILDVSLMEAGIIPREAPESALVGAMDAPEV